MLVDAIGQQHARAAPGARIVSLVPSITELLFALGLDAQVVGRTGFCVHPRDKVRRVTKIGGTKDIDFDALAALAASHVIVNIDENTRPDYERLCAMVPNVIVTHPNAPEDNIGLFQLLGGIFAREDAAAELVSACHTALQRLRVAANSLPARRVLYLIWRDPWMTVSSETYIARMLALVNWQVVAPIGEARYPQLTPDDFRALSPDAVLLSSEPYRFREKHLAEIRALCASDTDCRLVDGEMLSWYGNRAIPGMHYLADLAAADAEAAA